MRHDCVNGEVCLSAPGVAVAALAARCRAHPVGS